MLVPLAHMHAWEGITRAAAVLSVAIRARRVKTTQRSIAEK